MANRGSLVPRPVTSYVWMETLPIIQLPGAKMEVMKSLYPQKLRKLVQKFIGKFEIIQPVRLLVALKKSDEVEPFTCHRSWTVPRTVVQLSSGQL